MYRNDLSTGIAALFFSGSHMERDYVVWASADRAPYRRRWIIRSEAGSEIGYPLFVGSEIAVIRSQTEGMRRDCPVAAPNRPRARGRTRSRSATNLNYGRISIGSSATILKLGSISVAECAVGMAAYLPLVLRAGPLVKQELRSGKAKLVSATVLVAHSRPRVT